jgi:threonine/homoserine/homoserine lactone efflux protein
MASAGFCKPEVGELHRARLRVRLVRQVGEFNAAWRGRRSAVCWPCDLAAWRQGFGSDTTELRVLLFYLAVLPQFLPAKIGVAVLVAFALSHFVASGLGA